MAKRPTQPPAQPQPASLDRAGMRRAIEKIARRIRDIDNLDPSAITDFWGESRTLADTINATLAEVFGVDSLDYHRAHASGHNFMHSGTFSLLGGGQRESREDYIAAFTKGKAQAKRVLENEIRLLNERLEDQLPSEPVEVEPSPRVAATPEYNEREVFVVHGHADGPKQEVARFLQAAGLEPKILHELANGGRTVIEKLEDHTANIGFAVVVLTPDDVGGPTNGEQQPRARQNVIAELFYFMGKIGRHRVVPLKRGSLEVPSDAAGVVYVDMDDRGAWKMDLVRELKNAGYNGDWPRALGLNG